MVPTALLVRVQSVRTFHTLYSDLPLMRFFFISPEQKTSSLHTGSETVSEFGVFSKRKYFLKHWVKFIWFSLHTRSSSCQLGKCRRKLLLMPLIAMKSCNALDLPLSGISINTVFVCKDPTPSAMHFQIYIRSDALFVSNSQYKELCLIWRHCIY